MSPQPSLTLAAIALLFAFADSASAQINTTPVRAVDYGLLQNPGFTRDSCTVVSWYAPNNNVLWTCRDTVRFNDDTKESIPFPWASSASYSVKPSPSNPAPLSLLGTKTGEPFYPFPSNACPTSGVCSDGTRWYGWPDNSPVVVYNYGGNINAYAFVQDKRNTNPETKRGTILYQVQYKSSDGYNLPTVSIVQSGFWAANQPPYGNNGGFVYGDYVYLYGGNGLQPLESGGGVAVARSRIATFGSNVPDKSTYEYYVNGAWTRTAPTLSTPGLVLANTVDSSGQYYYSPKWNSFVWIGANGRSNADFFITTAPRPEGPWQPIKQIYSGKVGTDTRRPAYSAAAAPGLTDGTGNYIFVTWTTQSLNSKGASYNENRFARIDWA